MLKNFQFTLVSCIIEEKSCGRNFVQKNELGYDIIDSNTVGQKIIENFVSIRILDSCGNIVLGENVMEPGTSLELDALQDDTEYVVEVKTTADFVLLNFH